MFLFTHSFSSHDKDLTFHFIPSSKWGFESWSHHWHFVVLHSSKLHVCSAATLYTDVMHCWFLCWFGTLIALIKGFGLEQCSVWIWQIMCSWEVSRHPHPTTPLPTSHSFPSPIVMCVYKYVCVYILACFQLSSCVLISSTTHHCLFTTVTLIYPCLKVLRTHIFPFKSGRAICRKQVHTNLSHEKKQLKDLD